MRIRAIFTLLPLAGALALVLGVTPTSAGGGCYQPNTEGTGTTVELREICFSPTVLYIQPGDSVTWVNRDGIQHIVAGPSTSWGPSTTLEAGQSFTKQFATAGVYPYNCPLHFAMDGVVIVGDGKSSSLPVAHVQPAATAKVAGSSTTNPALLLTLGVAALTGMLGYAVGRLRRRSAGVGSAAGTSWPE